MLQLVKHRTYLRCNQQVTDGTLAFDCFDTPNYFLPQSQRCMLVICILLPDLIASDIYLSGGLLVLGSSHGQREHGYIVSINVKCTGYIATTSPCVCYHPSSHRYRPLRTVEWICILFSRLLTYLIATVKSYPSM